MVIAKATVKAAARRVLTEGARRPLLALTLLIVLLYTSTAAAYSVTGIDYLLSDGAIFRM
jgi:hypothetical protein